ncbi:hypothetical protein AJ87_11900 [Rhizobium yanglingense]|nr:hypothetical protein AJ87_11900 [Rhizobium yanglingense]
MSVIRRMICRFGGARGQIPFGVPRAATQLCTEAAYRVASGDAIKSSDNAGSISAVKPLNSKTSLRHT